MDVKTITSWEQFWSQQCAKPSIINEYRMAFLLNVFQKFCSKMEKDISFKKNIRNLFLQSYSKLATTKGIIKKYYCFVLPDDDYEVLLKWFNAYFKKSDTRKTVPASLKKQLYSFQNGCCAVCGNNLGNVWREIHVDHIIPWKLVGDELENNYQLLCNTCNECKSAKTDYLFKNIINLV